MANNREPSEFKTARQASGLLIFVTVAVLMVLDAFRTDFEVNPLVVIPVLAIGAALFAVDVRDMFSR